MIRNSLKLLAVAVVTTGVLGAAPAEARFGKRSEPAEKAETRKSSKSSKKARQTTTASRTHAASPVGSPSGRVRHDHGHSHSRVVVRSRPHYYHPWYWGYGYYAAPTTVIVHDTPREPEPQVERRDDGPELRHFEMGVSAQPLLNGGIWGLNLTADWRQLGIDLRFDDLALRSDGYTDHIRMFDATGTFGLITGKRGRLRAHVGAYSAFAPDATFIGPGGGLSTSVRILGPLTAEASGQLVLFPFTKVDTRAALGLRVGPFEGRLGWRTMYLDDQGHVDGVRNAELITGPYLAGLIAF